MVKPTDLHTDPHASFVIREHRGYQTVTETFFASEPFPAFPLEPDQPGQGADPEGSFPIQGNAGHEHPLGHRAVRLRERHGFKSILDHTRQTGRSRDPDDAVGRTGHGFDGGMGIDDIVKVPVVESIDPGVVGAHPDPAVIVLRERCGKEGRLAILESKRLESFAGEAICATAIRCDPDTAFTILKQGLDPVIGQALLRAKPFELPVAIMSHALALRSNP